MTRHIIVKFDEKTLVMTLLAKQELFNVLCRYMCNVCILMRTYAYMIICHLFECVRYILCYTQLVSNVAKNERKPD